MLRIVVEYDNRRREFPLPADRATVGSLDDNDIPIHCSGVSKKHAQLTRVGDRLLIEDLHSKNGVVADGKPVSRIELAAGDAVEIGRARLRLERVSTSGAELAFALPPLHVSPPQDGQRLTDTLEVAASAPASAIRWMREAESAGALLQASRRRQMIARALQIAGMDGIVVVRPETTGFSLAAYEGQSLPENIDELEPLIHEASSAKVLIRANQVAVPLNDGRIAIFHATTPLDAAPWLREFVIHVARKVFDGATIPAGDVPKRARSELVYPSEYTVEESPVMRDVYRQLLAAAATDITVLIRGERGVGKEPTAHMLHLSGRRASRPFLTISCPALVQTVAEAELFGIRSGVATGVTARKGYFVEADRGTLFLDEIGDLLFELQPKLLRALEAKEVQAVGAARPVAVDVRIVAATNQPLEKMVGAGTFRADLFSRLDVFPIVIPPLREHPEDIARLTFDFIERIAQEQRREIAGLTRRALALLEQYHWPGNVRELRNAIIRAVALCPDGGRLEPSHFESLGDAEAPPRSGELKQHVKSAEREKILDVLRRTHNNRSATARHLGISRAALYDKIREFGIDDDPDKDDL